MSTLIGDKPAMPLSNPHHARRWAILAVLGNDDFLLDLMRQKASAEAIRDYVAWTLETSRALGIKVINAGGAAAFKANVRSFSLDDDEDMLRELRLSFYSHSVAHRPPRLCRHNARPRRRLPQLRKAAGTRC